MISSTASCIHQTATSCQGSACSSISVHSCTHADVHFNLGQHRRVKTGNPMHKTLNSPSDVLLQKQPCAGFKDSQHHILCTTRPERSCCLGERQAVPVRSYRSPNCPPVHCPPSAGSTASAGVPVTAPRSACDAPDASRQE